MCIHWNNIWHSVLGSLSSVFDLVGTDIFSQTMTPSKSVAQQLLNDSETCWVHREFPDICYRCRSTCRTLIHVWFQSVTQAFSEDSKSEISQQQRLLRDVWTCWLHYKLTIVFIGHLTHSTLIGVCFSQWHRRTRKKGKGILVLPIGPKLPVHVVEPNRTSF